MARKKKKPEGGAGAPLFMATYGDMVTLLLTFFVLLYSMSSLDVQKFTSMAMSFQTAFGVLPGGQTSQTTPGIQDGALGQNPGDAVESTTAMQEKLARQMRALAKEEGLEKQISVKIEQRGVVVSFSEQALFAQGSAVIRPEGLRILFKVGQVIKTIPNIIAVEGHTDSRPMEGIVNSVYPDNWSISAARAASVAAYLENNVGIVPERLLATGYSSHKPVVPNDTEEHRALNRRVDLVLLSDYPVR